MVEAAPASPPEGVQARFPLAVLVVAPNAKGL